MSHLSDYSLLDIFFYALNFSGTFRSNSNCSDYDALVFRNALQVEVKVRTVEFPQCTPFLN